MSNNVLTGIGWIFSVYIAILMSIVAYSFDYTVSSISTSILTTLVLAQASIFAIVFSVLIFGVRFSASRYSPRIATEFTEDRSYKVTVGIFAGSIGYDILLLYLVPGLPDYLLTGLTIAAAWLATVAFLKLYVFVNETLQRATPEGILAYLEEHLTPKTILAEAKKSVQESTNRDPFIILISVIRSAIEQADRVTSSIGLGILGDAISELLKTISEDEFQEGKAIDQSLEKVLNNDIPTIVKEALDADITQIATESVETAEDIGETAIDEKLDRPLELVIRGQTDLISTIGYSSDAERVRKEVIDTSRGLVKDAAGKGLYDSSAIGTRLLGWTSAMSIMNRNQDQRHGGRSYTILISSFYSTLAEALDSDPSLTEYRNTAWLRRRTTDVNPADLLVWACYDSMAELTAAGIRYELRIKTRFLNWNLVADGWMEGLRSLQKTDLEMLPRVWFGTILYLCYVAEHTPGEIMPDFEPRIYLSVNSEFATETIRMILAQDIDPRSRLEHTPGGVNPLEYPRTGSRSPIVKDAEIEWEDWLEQQRKEYKNLPDTRFAPPVDSGQSDSEDGGTENNEE